VDVHGHPRVALLEQWVEGNHQRGGQQADAHGGQPSCRARSPGTRSYVEADERELLQVHRLGVDGLWAATREAPDSSASGTRTRGASPAAVRYPIRVGGPADSTPARGPGAPAHRAGRSAAAAPVRQPGEQQDQQPGGRHCSVQAGGCQRLTVRSVADDARAGAAGATARARAARSPRAAGVSGAVGGPRAGRTSRSTGGPRCAGADDVVEGRRGVGEVEQAFRIALQPPRVVAVKAVAEYNVRWSVVRAVGTSARSAAGTCRVINPALV